MSAPLTFDVQNGRNTVQHLVAQIPVVLGIIGELNPAINEQFLSYGISPVILGFIVSIIGYMAVEFIAANGNVFVAVEKTVIDMDSLTQANSPETTVTNPV
jgi:hypothetical protein